MYMGAIQDSAELAIRNLFKKLAVKTQDLALHAIDYMDDGTPIQLKVTINADSGSALFDFTGTGPEVYGNWNAPEAICSSAVIYALRCMVDSDIPLNHGCIRPITLVIPEHSLLKPGHKAAVCAGNVLTSQRIVDVIFRAFGACAASQGCMNNLTFGLDGGGGFGYYETIAGGSGCGPLVAWDERRAHQHDQHAHHRPGVPRAPVPCRAAPVLPQDGKWRRGGVPRR